MELFGVANQLQTELLVIWAALQKRSILQYHEVGSANNADIIGTIALKTICACKSKLSDQIDDIAKPDVLSAVRLIETWQ